MQNCFLGIILQYLFYREIYIWAFIVSKVLNIETKTSQVLI